MKISNKKTMCFLLEHYDHYIMPGTNRNVHPQGNGGESLLSWHSCIGEDSALQTLKTQI